MKKRIFLILAVISFVLFIFFSYPFFNPSKVSIITPTLTATPRPDPGNPENVKAFQYMFSIFIDQKTFVYEGHPQETWYAKVHLRDLIVSSWSEMTRKEERETAAKFGLSDQDFSEKYLDNWPELGNGESDMVFFFNLSASETMKIALDVEYKIFQGLSKNGISFPPITGYNKKEINKVIGIVKRILPLNKKLKGIPYNQKLDPFQNKTAINFCQAMNDFFEEFQYLSYAEKMALLSSSLSKEEKRLVLDKMMDDYQWKTYEDNNTIENKLDHWLDAS